MLFNVVNLSTLWFSKLLKSEFVVLNNMCMKWYLFWPEMFQSFDKRTLGLKTGLPELNDIFWSEIGSGFGDGRAND